MATQIWEFEGPIKYAKVYEPDVFRGSSRYLVNVYLNEKQEKHYNRSGIQGKIKEDEDGRYVTFRRDESKKMGKDLVEFTPPFIYDKDGKPLVRYVDQEGKPCYSHNARDNVEVTQEGERFGIGNDTKAKVRVSVYDTSMGKGCRLENLVILDLVEYSSGGPSVISAENSLDGEEGESVPTVDFSDLEDEELQTKAKAPKSTEKKSKDTKKPEEGLPW